MTFEQVLEKKWLLFDGAMGTQLQEEGLNLGEVPEALNIKDPERITKIHKAYVKAGARVISTNTFGASPYKLKEAGLSVRQVIEKGIACAKKSGAPYIALDLGPLGPMMAPLGSLSFEEAYEGYKTQVQWSQGADLVLIETLSDLNEARAAVLAVKENTNLPVVVSMTFQEDGTTLTGLRPEAFVNAMEGLNVSGLGVNCSLGPKALMPIVKKILEWTNLPIIVQANAGLPLVVDGQIQYQEGPEAYKTYGQMFLQAGVKFLGGCCGTTPDHIKALSQIEVQIKDRKLKEKDFHLSSATCLRSLSEFLVIGERINPTGNKLLKADLKNGLIDSCLKEGLRQVEAGAHVLDLNVGLPGIEEEELMKALVDEIAMLTDVPLQIDSANPRVIEAGLRRFPGIGIINSVSGKKKAMAELFPLAKKYGAMVVCLTLDDSGIPHTAEERFEIASRMIETAKSYGICEERLIIDTLTLTVSAQQKEVLETLRAIKMIKEKYRVKTVLGISNISYGMPNRSLLTRTFLTLALEYGLDAGIMDPTDEKLMDTLRATAVLLNKDPEGVVYTEKVRNYHNPQTEKSESSFLSMVLKGYKKDVKSQTDMWLQTMTPLEIIDEKLIKTLDQVGEKYQNKEIFLPQLIRGAETIGVAFDTLKSLLERGRHQLSKGKIVLATVQGDVHDIGKNLVKILLENYGFQVIDLGKDVCPEKILQAIIEHNVDLLGLSALMTTTVVSMEKTIKLVKSQCPNVKIFVGGAVLTKEYADLIGSDYYCKDAKASVAVAQGHYQGIDTSK